ncbi:immunoglobulin-like domain-containing protein [Lutibacter maritimus]|uniref:Pesticidal crystal protein Cry22Aa Ig-like domain-containing protein n=1 Tax=Lutibacter maritimus TaxID=593133 RepID=A0A1I6RYS9_9FLAO|nr:immunoglobulin-like domain-containing protein [Lutibacter maritimus]SFS69852.1 protein of unknown function [Lutibacter maritimus]
MKNIYIYILLVSVLFFIACEDDTTDDVSSITNFAVFDYSPFTVVPLGGSFTPGATAKEGETEVDVVIEGTVDTNTVGFYTISYSATNSDGFVASAFETVLVHDPTIIGSDVTGCFHDVGRPSRTGCITLVDGTTSIFLASDFGYAGTFPVYFQMDGDEISYIPQPLANGNAYVDLTYDPVTGTFTCYIPALPFLYTFQFD